MQINQILLDELKGSVKFFLDTTNLDPNSPGYGLAVDSTKNPNLASIASVGFALTAWVIAAERGFLSLDQCLEIVRGTLRTLRDQASHHRGFFAHFMDIHTGERARRCEYSTIDTALCLNGVIIARAYFNDPEVSELAQELLHRVDWNYLVFEEDGKTLFRMAYNPDLGGDYVRGEPGFISSWNMAAEQRKMYLQAAAHVHPEVARALHRGFTRDIGYFEDQPIIITPGGTLFVYLFTDAWLDTGRYLDPDGVDWFNNTRLAALANRAFCSEHARKLDGTGHKTYHERSWGLSAGDSPWGYEVAGATPSLIDPRHSGTVSIYSALACLPYIPEQVIAMIQYLLEEHPQTWGPYGFYDAYNLDPSPPWYSQALYGIGKGCSMIMVENYLTRLVWETYTNSPYIQNALNILGYTKI